MKKKRVNRSVKKENNCEFNDSTSNFDGKCMISSTDQTKLNFYENNRRVNENNFVNVAQKDEQTMQITNGKNKGN